MVYLDKLANKVCRFICFFIQKFRSMRRKSVFFAINAQCFLERRHKMFYGAIKEDITSQLGLERKRLKGKDRSDLKKKDANGPLADRIPLPNA